VVSLFSLLGMISVVVSLLVLGRLSHRLGKVTRAPRFYLGFYGAGVMIGLSVLARLLGDLNITVISTTDAFWVFLIVGLPAFALTLSLIIAWRYWSWLLAERG
jgi:hypothetical protein